ncbi:hypothetical protein [Clostridium sardiniense]|uniref:hypothetical protein n=1 Tax=Clostridium sardiniense TaxID=29369 RepID=UPI003D32CD97
MKNFSKGCLVVAATLAVQLSLSSAVNAQTIKENNINSKISIQDDKDNKNEKIKESKESSALEAPDNKSEKSENSKKSNATKVPDNKVQKSEDKKIKDSKESSALEAPDNKSEKSEDSKKSNATKVPDNKVQKSEDKKIKDSKESSTLEAPDNKAKKPEDNKGDKAQKPGKNEADKSQKTKENNIPKLMKVNQISPNQIEISYDRDVDVELGSKATNYWVQDTMNDKPKGIASLGKNDKVEAKNSLTDDKVRIEAKEDSQRTFVLTFSKDIPKGAEYKLIICYVTVEGAPPYTGDNGMMTFVGK